MFRVGFRYNDFVTSVRLSDILDFRIRQYHIQTHLIPSMATAIVTVRLQIGTVFKKRKFPSARCRFTALCTGGRSALQQFIVLDYLFNSPASANHTGWFAVAQCVCSVSAGHKVIGHSFPLLLSIALLRISRRVSLIMLLVR